MEFRCLSFHQANADVELCRLAASLGFNWVELQTELSHFRNELGLPRGAVPLQSEGLRATHQRLTRHGTLQALKAMGLRISLWTREIEDYQPDRDGPLSVDNDRLFEALRQRYHEILTEIFPEADAIALTVAETSTWVDDPRMIDRICRTVREVCQVHGRRLIVRSFAYERQRAAVGRVMRHLPEDVWLMSKYGPRDWHIQGVRNPLIGNLDPKREIVEEDIAGEYHLTNETANCMVDAYRSRFAPLKRLGIAGMTLRCNRGPELSHNRQGVIYGEAQEANLWACASWMQEELPHDQQVIEPIRRWAAHTFGDDAPLDELVAIVRPTGAAMTEALYVCGEPMGDTRNAVPLVHTTGGDALQRSRPIIPARRYSDAEAEMIGDHTRGADPAMPWGVASAYQQPRANYPHEPALLAHYHRLRRGHPGLIADKSATLADASQAIDRSIERFDHLRDRLPAEPWQYLRFKLRRTRREVAFRGQAALAYMLGCQRLYSDDPALQEDLAARIRQHLRAIDAMIAEAAAAPETEQRHRGRSYTFSSWPPGMQAFADNLVAHFDLARP